MVRFLVLGSGPRSMHRADLFLCAFVNGDLSTLQIFPLLFHQGNHYLFFKTRLRPHVPIRDFAEP